MKLDTLYLELKATTDELQRNLRAADTRIGTTEKLLNKMAHSANNAESKFTRLAKAVANVKNILLTSALAGATASLVASTSKATAEIYELSKMFDIPIHKLNVLDRELRHFGGSARDIVTDLANLTKSYREMTGVDISGAEILEKLPKLAKDLEKIDPLVAFQHLKDVGFGDPLAKFILTGEAAVSKYLKNSKLFSTFTNDEAEAIYKANKQLEEFFNTMRDLSNRLLVTFSPEIKKLADAFEKFSKNIRDNPEYIRELISKYGGWAKNIAVAAAAVWFLANVFIILTGVITVATTAFKVLRAAMLFLLANPWVALFTAIAAAIGYVIYKWDDWAPKIKEWVTYAKSELQRFLDYFNSIFDRVQNTLKNVFSWPGMKRFDYFEVNQKIQHNAAQLTPNPFYTYPAASVAGGGNTYIDISGVDITSNATSVKQLTKDILSYNGQSFDTNIRQAMSNFDDGVAN